jgi:predicted LPLAT superfamily acyltransferase
VNDVLREAGSADHARGAWRGREERGSPFLIRFMARLSLALGRAPVRPLLHFIAAYFFATSGAARLESRRYLARVLGREPGLRERYRHFLSFASTIHDRVFFVADRFEPFDIRVVGAECVDETPAGEGVFLLGGHLGSFEVARACGRDRTHRPVTMAMFPENAQKIHAVLEAINPKALDGIVALGHVDSMLRLDEALGAGSLVGVLADRAPEGEKTVRLPFLGEPASFPTGPMRLAAVLRRPVVFMAGLYLGGNRYEVRFEPLADFSALPEGGRAGREALVSAAVARYAECLERNARRSPYSWFNFHDFWAPPRPR